MCTTLYYIILTRWPLTNSQSIHFPQFATTRLSKIWFSRLTLISPYCYCDSYYYYYCYLLWFFVMFVVTCCVRLYDLLFCILSFLIGCPNALKVLANLTCGIWLCTNSSTLYTIYGWICLSLAVHASSGSLPILLIDSQGRWGCLIIQSVVALPIIDHLSRYANAFAMQLMPTAQLMMLHYITA